MVWLLPFPIYIGSAVWVVLFPATLTGCHAHNYRATPVKFGVRNLQHVECDFWNFHAHIAKIGDAALVWKLPPKFALFLPPPMWAVLFPATLTGCHAHNNHATPVKFGMHNLQHVDRDHWNFHAHIAKIGDAALKSLKPNINENYTLSKSIRVPHSNQRPSNTVLITKLCKAGGKHVKRLDKISISPVAEIRPRAKFAVHIPPWSRHAGNLCGTYCNLQSLFLCRDELALIF